MSYLVGNTIKMTAQFSDWGGNPVDPSLIKFILYNNKYQKLDEIQLDPNSKVGIGEYVYYHIPQSSGYFVYEFYAEIDGLPSLDRKSFQVEMIK